MIRICFALVAAATLWAGDCAISPLLPHRANIRTMAAGDGSIYATSDGVVRLWNNDRLLWVARGDPLPPTQPGAEPVQRLVVGPRLVVATEGGTTQVLRRGDGVELVRAKLPTVAVSPDATWLVLRSAEGYAFHRAERPADPPAGSVRTALRSRVALSQDGRRAWVAERDPAVIVHLELADGVWRETRRQALPGAPIIGIESVALPDGGERIVLARQLGVLLLDIHTDFAAPPRTVGLEAAWSEIRPAGLGWLAVRRTFSPCFLIDVATGTVREAGEGTTAGALQTGVGIRHAHERSIMTPAADPGNPDGTLVAGLDDAALLGLLASPDRRLLWVSGRHGLGAWDLALLRLQAAIPGPTVRGLVATPVPGVGMWASDQDGGRWHLVDLAGHRDLGHIGGAAGILPAFAADGSWVACADQHTVRCWRLPGGAEAGTMPLPAWERDTIATQLVPSADGRRLCVARMGDRDVQIRGGYESMPPRWSVLAAELPTLRPLGGGLLVIDRAEHDPSRLALYRQPPPRLVTDGEGWAVDFAVNRHRIAADGSPASLTPCVAGIGEVTQPVPLQELPGAGDGPWYARLVASIDALGLCRLRAGDGPSVSLATDGDAWAVWDAQGRFDGSRSAPRLLAAFNDGRTATLAEIAPWANRPDALLRALGCDDSALLAVAARPADRRVRPTGEGPALTVTNARADEAALQLALRLGAGSRLEAWIDGVPWTPPQPGSDGAVAFAVPADGAAQIELAASTPDGRRSARVVESLPGRAAASGRVVAACLGVSRYRDPSLALRYAAKDALDLRLALGDGEADARSWTDAEVVAGALPQIAAHLARAGREDTVVLTLAGHGLYVREPEARWLFLPWDADPARVAETGIPWSAIEGLFTGCAARRRLVILDTCESGALDDDAPVVAGLSIPGARGLRRTRDAVADAGLAGEFRASDRSRFVTADLAGGSGAVVLASSRGGEPSFESDAERNGLFTAVLLRGLRGEADGVGLAGRERDGQIGAGELVRFTAAEVSRLSGGRQRPTIDRDNPFADIVLPVLPAAE
jgi:hypothetical protein